MNTGTALDTLVARHRPTVGLEAGCHHRPFPNLPPSQHSPVPRRHRNISDDFWPGTLPRHGLREDYFGVLADDGDFPVSENQGCDPN
jgi:hypothetical protein